MLESIASQIEAQKALKGAKVMARSDSNLIPPQLLELTDWSSERVCEEIFGPIANVWVYPLVHDHLPYGGVKESGPGRKGVRSAMDEYTDVKVLALS